MTTKGNGHRPRKIDRDARCQGACYLNVDVTTITRIWDRLHVERPELSQTRLNDRAYIEYMKGARG